MDEQLKHCCGEAGIGSKSRGRLVDVGISTISQLLQFEENELKNLCSNNCDDVLECVCLIAQWLRSNPNADVLNEFDDDVFNKFKQDIRKKQEEMKEWVNVYITEVLGKPYQKKNESLWKDANSKPDLLQEIIRQCKKEIMAPEYLQKLIGKSFNHDSYIEKSTLHLHNIVPLKDFGSGKIIVISGRTQAGKSAVKGIIQSQCQLLRIAMIVLTKGVDESIELAAKLRAQGRYVVVATNKHETNKSHKSKEEKIKEALINGGVLVIADTQSQVLKKACKMIDELRQDVEGAQFVLVVDEADAMFRTVERKQAFEKAFLQLRGLKPLMTILISATPISFMLDLVFEHEEAAENIEYYHLEPSDDYVGIDHMRPVLEDGKEIFLEQNEISLRSEFQSIPWANKKVVALYDDAIRGIRTGCKGILLLDCSCPRVYADRNLGEKAEAVQDYVNRKWKKGVIVIVVSGSFKWVRFPGQEWEKERWKKSRIGCILNYIDSHADYGLGIPVFIFGYTKLCRGVSFRSNNRVPTHMLMSLGRGHNCSTVVQTLGRATFNGKSLLTENGFNHVTILVTQSDFKLCKASQEFIDTVSSRVHIYGDTFEAAFTGANEKLPHHTNFFYSSFREIGKLKGQRKKFKDSLSFKEPPMELSASEERIKELFWDDDSVQQVLRSLSRLSNEKAYRAGHLQVDVDDVVDDLWQFEKAKVTKTKLNASLRKLCDNTVIFKEDGSYSIPPAIANRLALFLNSKKCKKLPGYNYTNQNPNDSGDDESFTHEGARLFPSNESSGESSSNESLAERSSGYKPETLRQVSLELDSVASADKDNKKDNSETKKNDDKAVPAIVTPKKGATLLDSTVNECNSNQHVPECSIPELNVLTPESKSNSEIENKAGAKAPPNATEIKGSDSREFVSKEGQCTRGGTSNLRVQRSNPATIDLTIESDSGSEGNMRGELRYPKRRSAARVQSHEMETKGSDSGKFALKRAQRKRGRSCKRSLLFQVERSGPDTNVLTLESDSESEKDTAGEQRYPKRRNAGRRIKH